MVKSPQAFAKQLPIRCGLLILCGPLYILRERVVGPVRDRCISCSRVREVLYFSISHPQTWERQTWERGLGLGRAKVPHSPAHSHEITEDTADMVQRGELSVSLDCSLRHVMVVMTLFKHKLFSSVL